MRFYSVKERKMVEVPDSEVKPVRYEWKTRSGKTSVRYALKVAYKGQRFHKFVDEATYRKFAPAAPGAPLGTSRKSAASPSRLDARYEERVGDVFRRAAAQCGLDWDKMDDDERTAFVAKWLDD